MGLFPGDILVAGVVLLVAILLGPLGADPNEVDRNRKEFYDKLYAEDAERYSRQ